LSCAGNDFSIYLCDWFLFVIYEKKDSLSVLHVPVSSISTFGWMIHFDGCVQSSEYDHDDVKKVPWKLSAIISIISHFPVQTN
jgi:hypothetical protein